MSSEYPSDWNSRRKSVYKRDDYTCKNCGIQGGPYGNAELHAHHVVPKSRGGTHNVSNLISLCNQCHKTVHSKNSQAPTEYQHSEGGVNYGDPDFGELAGIILEDSQTIFTLSADLLEDTYDKLEKESLDFGETLEIENKLRIGIIRTFENIETLGATSPTGYSTDIAKATISCVKQAEETLLIVMSTLELVEECIIDLVDQATSCPKCGTSIDESGSFCTGCGADLFEMIPSCPECDSEVHEEDTFCGECGAELEEYEKSTIGTAEVGLGWFERMEKNLERLDEASEEYVISSLSLDVQNRVASEFITSVIWEYCPSCGFPEGTVRSASGIDCVVCDGEWIDKGILNRTIKMTHGIESGKSMPESEWEPMAKQRNQNERYREILFPDH